jgi:hypothetical protein
MSHPVEIPTVDQLLADPTLATTLPPEAARTILCAVAGLVPVLVARASEHSTPQAELPTTPGRWITVKEAVALFAVTPRWFYCHKHLLPYSQPSHKVLLFDEDKLRKWFQAHKVR